MSTTDGSKTSPSRASVTQILADLLVTGHDKHLPEMADARTGAGHSLVVLDFNSFDDMLAWRDALQPPGEVSGFINSDHPDGVLTTFWIEDRHGWQINLCCLGPNPLPDETVQKLRAVITA